MHYNKHYSKQKHAFLSPSNYHWLNYDEEKLYTAFRNAAASELGTKLHALAEQLINLGQKLPCDGSTLSMYVNDCIDNDMDPEIMLWYSDNCFGTADAIRFDQNELFIFDLKTGATGNMKQLMIYAALFCLEYDYSPTEIEIELRLYISGTKQVYRPEDSEITRIMAKIVEFDSIIEEAKHDLG